MTWRTVNISMKPFLTTLRVVDPPSSEPIDLATARKYCRVYTDYEDDVIQSLVTTARIMVEQYLARSLNTQTLQWTVKFEYHTFNPYGLGAGSIVGLWGGWGYTDRHDTMELARAPVQTVNSVVLRDHDGNDVPIDDTTYSLDIDMEPARLCLFWDKIAQITNPPVLPIQHIQIEFDAGYTDTIPTPITQAILLMVNYLYERRGDEIAMPDMPKAIFYLLDPFKLTFFGGTP